ncbi:signal peptide peptidase SppA [Membranihabitans marinus]|uniref:signal peptide peptidase SppA n=1 Tax=Membranihabitans marinus TaxID=1227546 RepID=UPI001F003559|nr:signal peptide peptidase SppA [Membranihabitans marinus]
MRTFFQSVLGSCLGVLLAIFLVILIGIGMGSVFYSADKQKPDISANTVLKINFSEVVPEKRNNSDAQGFEQIFEQEDILGIHDYAALIERAGEDKNIKGLYLNLKNISLGLTKREILEDAIKKFKTSGKFVIAYSDYYTNSAYHLASNADEIAIFPNGSIDLRGMAAVVPHFKSLSDKIGVEFETYFAGKFKSATEPFRLSKMSESNKLQTRSYLGSMNNILLDDIEANRGIDSIQLQKIINDYSSRSAKLALENNLVDKIGYEDEVMAMIREKLGLASDEKINMKSLDDYFTAKPLTHKLTEKNKIAVVYAEGEIHDGEERYGSISGDSYVKTLRSIREDNNVKAVVLRIDSPGGSALASEKIWRELKLIQEAGIPVVSSMGTYAASGGYYIASGSEYIISEPSTITGSIGVFFLLPKVNQLFNDKLGINVDTVTTNEFSASFTPFFPSSEKEKAVLQDQVDEIYHTFLERVSAARKMTIDDVNEIAQGRVWTGIQAKNNGLVDELGDLDLAIEKAASLANIENYRISEYPKIKQPLYKLLEELTGENFDASINLIKGNAHQLIKDNLVKELSAWSKPQARIPMEVIWE